jgi:hypothetical protein
MSFGSALVVTKLPSMKTRSTPAAWRFWIASRSPSNKRRRRGVVTKTASTSARVARCMPGGSSPMAFGAGIIQHAPQPMGPLAIDNDMTTFLLYQAGGPECTSNNVRFDQLSCYFISPRHQTCKLHKASYPLIELSNFWLASCTPRWAASDASWSWSTITGRTRRDGSSLPVCWQRRSCRAWPT